MKLAENLTIDMESQFPEKIGSGYSIRIVIIPKLVKTLTSRLLVYFREAQLAVEGTQEYCSVILRGQSVLKCVNILFKLPVLGYLTGHPNTTGIEQYGISYHSGVLTSLVLTGNRVTLFHL